MSAETALRDFLRLDASLLATLTGGVLSFKEDTASNGISRIAVPTAFTAAGWLKPTGMVKTRSELAFGGIRDIGVASTAQMVDVFLMVDERNGFSALNTARDRLFALIDRQYIADVGHVRWMGDYEGGDISLSAAQLRVECQIVGMRGN